MLLGAVERKLRVPGNRLGGAAGDRSAWVCFPTHVGCDVDSRRCPDMPIRDGFSKNRQKKPRETRRNPLQFNSEYFVQDF